MRSDEELAAAVARGDVDAFAALYDRFAARVYAWSAHLGGPSDAEDAVQEVFLRLWAKAGQFDPARGRFVVWFMAIARHHLIGVAKKRSTERRLAAAVEIVGVERMTQNNLASTVQRDSIGRTRQIFHDPGQGEHVFAQELDRRPGQSSPARLS